MDFMDTFRIPFAEVFDLVSEACRSNHILSVCVQI